MARLVEAKGRTAMTPGEIYEFWTSMRPSAGYLSELAIYNIMRPISSAGPERVFSYLTKLDQKDRRRMQATTLYNLLFLRSNWRVVRQLLRHEVAIRDAAPPQIGRASAEARADAVAAGQKRKAEEEAAAAAINALYSAARSRLDASQSAEASSDEDDSDDSDRDAAGDADSDIADDSIATLLQALAADVMPIMREDDGEAELSV